VSRQHELQAQIMDELEAVLDDMEFLLLLTSKQARANATAKLQT